MVPLIKCVILFAAVCAVGTPAPLTVLYLVERLEDEELALVLEGFGYLLPGLLDTLFDGGVRAAVVGSALDVEPVLIVVQVEDDVESGSLSPFHVLPDLSHIVGLYLPCGSVLVVTPGDTYAHGAGPGLLQVGVECLRRLGFVPVAPLRMLAVLTAAGVEVVAQVPAPAQFLGEGDGIVVCYDWFLGSGETEGVLVGQGSRHSDKALWQGDGHLRLIVGTVDREAQRLSADGCRSGKRGSRHFRLQACVG